MQGKNLKVLMIGNSFSICVGAFLPQIVKANPPHSLELHSTYIGGCRLQTHYESLIKAEAEDYTPYRINVWKSEDAPETAVDRAGNVNEMLKNNQYDIVTMQQASALSWKPETYEPYAAEIVKYIRKYQKNAEIVIQQTWAYRNDAPSFQEWGISQKEMYLRLKDAYHQFAERYGFRIIPTGDAVQLYRERTPVKFKKAERELKYPELQSMEGDLAGYSRWDEDTENNNGHVLHSDMYHLNTAGCFMQAALWFSFLYGEPASKAASSAPALTCNSNVDLLLKCAEDALNGSIS